MTLDPVHYLKHSQLQHGAAASIIDQMQLKQGLRILDIGCGDGKITAHLNDITGNAVGIDLCSNMVQFASATYPHVRFEKQNAEEMVFEHPFDIITCFSAIHWMRRLDQAFIRMHAALKPGGLAYILTYPEESIYWKPLEKAALQPEFLPYAFTKSPLYSIQTYHQMAQQAGFEIISSQQKSLFAIHDTQKDLRDYIQGWVPDFIQLPSKLMSAFIDLVVQYQIEQSVDHGDGKIHLPFTRFILSLRSKSK